MKDGLVSPTRRSVDLAATTRLRVRFGWVKYLWSTLPPELGFPIEIGDITVTECQMINQFKGSKTVPPQFTRGYGLAFGHSERKTMAMALVDRALRADELGETATYAAQDEVCPRAQR